MEIKIKIVVATILWTVAISTAIAYIVFGANALIVSTVITAAAAAVVSAMIAGDYIAASATRRLLEQIAARCESTIQDTVETMDAKNRQHVDRIVARVQSVNEAALRRVAGEILSARTEDRPTRLR